MDDNIIDIGDTLPKDMTMWQVYKLIINKKAICRCYKCKHIFTNENYWLPALKNGRFVCHKCDKSREYYEC